MTSMSIDDLDSRMERLEHLADIVEEVGPMICQTMRAHAVSNVPVDTGALKNSVASKDGDILIRHGDAEVIIGIETRMEYAKYVEFGTGTKGSADYNGHVSPGITFSPKSAWYQYDLRGVSSRDLRRHGLDGTEKDARILRFARKPRPFMRPALYDNIEKFKRIVEEAISKEASR